MFASTDDFVTSNSKINCRQRLEVAIDTSLAVDIIPPEDSLQRREKKNVYHTSPVLQQNFANAVQTNGDFYQFPCDIPF